MNKELLVEFRELNLLRLSCAKCKTKVLLDCTDLEAGIPEECPGCNKEYPASLRTALISYRELFKRLSDQAGVEVRIGTEE